MNRQVSERRASIDVGTNSVRLLVADVHPDGRVCALVRRGTVTRLGEGLDASGRISELPAERTIQAIASALAEARSSGARRIVLAATSALRSATNSPEVVSEIRSRTGLEVRILSGEEEARMVFRSIQTSAPTLERILVIDIGGGSTELAAGHGSELVGSVSLDLGCVRLYERAAELGGVDGAEGYAFARGLLRRELEAQIGGWREQFSGARLRGVGGTLTAFGMIFLGAREYDPDQLDGVLVPAAEQSRISNLLRNMPLEERRYWVGAGRADLISAGAAVLDDVMDFFRVPELQVSTRGLRYGLLFEPAQETPAQAPGPG